MTSDRQARADSTAGADAPAVELIGITKAFPGVVANDDINLAIAPGEVHCLLGENGAGKSTLMSVLSGLTSPTPAASASAARDVSIDSPRSALGARHRHGLPALTLVPTLSVLENLMLGEGSGVRLETTAAARRDWPRSPPRSA